MLRFLVSLMIILFGAEVRSTPVSIEDDTEALSFKVLLNDVEVGWHTFRFSNQGEYLSLIHI